MFLEQEDKRCKICTTIDSSLNEAIKRELYRRDIRLSDLLDEILAAYFNNMGRAFPPPIPSLGEEYGAEAKKAEKKAKSLHCQSRSRGSRNS